MSDASSGNRSEGDDRHGAVRRLADLACVRPLGPTETAELNALLASDLLLRQSYAAYLDVHSVLLRRRQSVTPTAVLRMLSGEDDASGAGPTPARRLRTGLIAAVASLTAVAAMAAVAVVGPEWFLGPPPALGHIVALADDVTWADDDAAAALGDIVRRGRVVALESGFVTFDLGRETMFDLVGPATVRFDGAGRVSLLQGRIGARVGERGRGFTVATEDADVVDLGTEFEVTKDFSDGTRVRVLEGRVATHFKDADGTPQRVRELLAGQAVRLDAFAGVVADLIDPADSGDAFAEVRAARGRAVRFSGAARPVAAGVPDFREGRRLTRGVVQVVPERVGVPHHDPAADVGVVDSYLFHYDIGDGAYVDATGRGSVTFAGPVIAVLSATEDLIATDAAYGVDGAVFGSVAHRGVEVGDDSVTVSPDGRTVLFDIDVTASRALDQFRVLVRGTP
ncbi:MAG: FecR domain-containing protein [Planctomycetota bacterium]